MVVLYHAVSMDILYKALINVQTLEKGPPPCRLPSVVLFSHLAHFEMKKAES